MKDKTRLDGLRILSLGLLMVKELPGNQELTRCVGTNVVTVDFANHGIGVILNGHRNHQILDKLASQRIYPGHQQERPLEREE